MQNQFSTFISFLKRTPHLSPEEKATYADAVLAQGYLSDAQKAELEQKISSRSTHAR